MKSLRKPYKNETDLKKQIIEAINQSRLAVIQNQPTGVFYARSGKRVSVGKSGNGDTKGIALGGFYLELEIKLHNEEQSEDQKARQKEVESWGGIYIVADSVEKALGKLRRQLATKLNP